MIVLEKLFFRFALAGVVVPLACGGVRVRAQQPDAGALIDKALAGDHHGERNRARDVHRHSCEPAVFFGLRPDMRASGRGRCHD